jgi:hypothetical protein
VSTDDATNDADRPDAPCSPCRATGKVISGLGGTPQTIDCPWCEGTGVSVAGHDAQAHWRDAGVDT